MQKTHAEKAFNALGSLRLLDSLEINYARVFISYKFPLKISDGDLITLSSLMNLPGSISVF